MCENILKICKDMQILGKISLTKKKLTCPIGQVPLSVSLPDGTDWASRAIGQSLMLSPAPTSSYFYRPHLCIFINFINRHFNASYELFPAGINRCSPSGIRPLYPPLNAWLVNSHFLISFIFIRIMYVLCRHVPYTPHL